MDVEFFQPHIGVGREYGYTTFVNEFREAWEAQGHRDLEGADRRICFCHPNSFIRDDRPTGIFTMYEASTMPQKFVRPINRADFVLVPSAWVKKIFRQNGVKKPIHIVPLGFDPEIFYPTWDFPEHPPIRILWLGAPDLRKGWDVFARAFQAAFQGPQWNVEITFKTSSTGGEDYQELVDGVVFDCRRLDRTQLADLYRAHHIFCFTSRGEGYGLPPLEAMASGPFTILPAAGGPMDYAAPDRCMMVKTKKRLAEFGVRTYVDEVKHGALVHALKHAVKNWAMLGNIRRQAVSWCHENRTWAHSATRMHEVLGRAFPD
jgi:glycosyltransferase involved in cell wall biosynthesis